MKRIVNFTQTYQGSQWSPGSDGKDRSFLIDHLLKNEDQIRIRQMLDLHTYSFHNVSKGKTEELSSKIKSVLPHTDFAHYNDVSFSHTILSQLRYFKSLGMTDVLWIQDDEFFTHPRLSDFVDLYNFYKENDDIKNINLLYDTSSFPLDWGKVESIRLKSGVVIYKTAARQLAQTGLFGMDNTSFLCDINMLLDRMYDDSFSQIRHAYQLEIRVRDRSVLNDIPRYITNTRFFEAFNIVGMTGSLAHSKEKMDKLGKIFPL